jgi:hypothetical protein
MGEFSSLFPTGMSHFLLGGLMIGAGVALLYLSTGLIGGMSSVFTTSWSYISKYEFFNQTQNTESRKWRLVYALGLVCGAFAWTYFSGDIAPTTNVSEWQLLIGGFIAGFGARFGNGCTSGHGICGMASLSLPSFMAVVVFLSVAIVTANIMAAFFGGAV